MKPWVNIFLMNSFFKEISYLISLKPLLLTNISYLESLRHFFFVFVFVFMCGTLSSYLSFSVPLSFSLYLFVSLSSPDDT